MKSKKKDLYKISGPVCNYTPNIDTECLKNHDMNQ